jgi:hypothetical protein
MTSWDEVKGGRGEGGTTSLCHIVPFDPYSEETGYGESCILPLREQGSERLYNLLKVTQGLGKTVCKRSNIEQ